MQKIYTISYEDKESTQFPTGLVVKPDDVDAEWIKGVVEATQTDEFKKKFNDFYGSVYKLFNDAN